MSTTQESYISDEKILEKKASTFADLGKAVHLKFKRGHWKNGVIIKAFSDFFIFHEFNPKKDLVYEDKIFFYIELRDIQLFTLTREKEDVENGAK